jgi:hypothetical protein
VNACLNVCFTGAAAAAGLAVAVGVVAGAAGLATAAGLAVGAACGAGLVTVPDDPPEDDLPVPPPDELGVEVAGVVEDAVALGAGLAFAVGSSSAFPAADE